MKHLVRFPLESGGTVIFEATETESPGAARSGRRAKDIVDVDETLEAALEKVKPAAELILAQLSRLSSRPSEIEVEFGLTVNAEVGLLIASGTVEANYIVKLKWAKKDSDDDKAS